ncbi:uncharacterized protein LOC128492535 [Spea bombifrons]|uniref:uncharacterized protein LOC128492535 n=1 Tax=Spea bombifrons TaxID=233779 RepID=UPI00234BCCCE|nr:uncharacterized protein LOC128492535 [Spea bombifrons]
MSLSQWMSSLFQTQRPTSSHLHLLNENQPLRDLHALKPVHLTGVRPASEEGLDEAFNQTLSGLGGRDNVLLVEEAVPSLENVGGSGGILQELSFALFQSPEQDSSLINEEADGGHKGMSCIQTRDTSRSRMLEFSVILAIFRETLIMEPSNATSIKEVLRDIRLRTKGSLMALVGIVYGGKLPGDKKMQSQTRLGQLFGQVFKGQIWGVCSYSRSQPETILEVKKTIKETLERQTTHRYQEELREDSESDTERSFRDLVCRLGGKERFLLVGNICPSSRPSERATVFKELSRALFEEAFEPEAGKGSNEGAILPHLEHKSGECTQLPKPRSFPYPLILVVFRYTFVKDEVNWAQVKEILADVRIRSTRCTQVIGVVWSSEELEDAQWETCRSLLHKILRQTFGGGVGICSYIRSKPETVDNVKRCICDVVKERRS